VFALENHMSAKVPPKNGLIAIFQVKSNTV
jgi:hypothetical protein